MTRVLVVDDDPTVADVVLAYLRRDGIEAAHAADGLTALDSARRVPPDLVVLDLMLPGLDGLEVCRRLRSTGDDLPVLVLTARDSVSERVAGLDAGADDYLPKPFALEELLARMRALLRRTVSDDGAESEKMAFWDLTLDPVTREVTRALRREDLMRDVWGWDFGDLSTVTVHVRRLREKVEVDPAAPVRLATVWGVGYRWDPTPGSPVADAAAAYGGAVPGDSADAR